LLKSTNAPQVNVSPKKDKIKPEIIIKTLTNENSLLNPNQIRKTPKPIQNKQIKAVMQSAIKSESFIKSPFKF